MSIANCGQDENKQYHGGQAGDQTKKEYYVRPWFKYSGGWTCVFRYPDSKIGEEIARIAKDAANNEHIGYDQYQRTTFYTQLKKVNWEPKDIKTNCEADCSASTVTVINAVGYLKNVAKFKNITQAHTTSTLKKCLTNAGFKCLTDSKYLDSDEYLMPGDIILKVGHHVTINLTNGSKVTSTTSSTTKTTTTTESTSTKTVKMSSSFKVYGSADNAINKKSSTATYEAGTYTVKKTSGKASLLVNSKHTTGGWVVL